MCVIYFVGRRYLKRMSGIRLEDLLERFRALKMEPTFRKKETNKKYLRDSEIAVKADLEKLFKNYDIIPSTGVTTRLYKEQERYIELETFYSEVIPQTDKERAELGDEQVIILDEEMQRAIGLKENSPFLSFPKERIRIYEMD